MPDFVDLSRVESYLGRPTFERGRAYADNGQVLRMRRDTHDRIETVRGAVVGQGGLYETTASVLLTGDGQRLFSGGNCTCPMVEDCKHVAALVRGGQPRRAPRSRRTRRRAATWDEPLRALMSPRRQRLLGVAPRHRTEPRTRRHRHGRVAPDGPAHAAGGARRRLGQRRAGVDEPR